MDANIESALRKCATDWPASATTIRAYIDALAAERDALLAKMAAKEGLLNAAINEIGILERRAEQAEAECARLREDAIERGKRVSILACFQAGDDPFVFGINGMLTENDIAAINFTLCANPDLCDQGDGDYLFYARYEDGQYDNYGRVEFPAGWDLDLVEFTPATAIDQARQQGKKG